MGRECSNVIGLSLNERNVNCCLLVVTCVVSINYANGWFVWKELVLKMSGIADAPEWQKLKRLRCRGVTLEFVPVRGFPQSCGPKFLLPVLLPLLPQTWTPPQSLCEVIGSRELFPTLRIQRSLSVRSTKLSSTQEAGSNAYLTVCWMRSLLQVDLRAGPRKSEAPHPLLGMYILPTVPTRMTPWETKVLLRPTGLNW